MKIRYLLLALFCSALAEITDGIETVLVAPTAETAIQPMKLFIGVVGKGSATPDGEKFIADLKRCCEWSGRFAITVQPLAQVPRKKREVKKLFQELYDCALFITYNGPHAPIEWRLYDTSQGTMLDGKRISSDGNAPAACKVADVVLKALTNEPQLFLSKIVYRKRDRRGISYLMVTDFDGTNAQVLLQSKRILVAPRWNNDPECPMIIFSEFTPCNVRLMMGDLRGRSLPVLDVEGTTVGVSCVQMSDDVVYCHSGDIWLYHYHPTSKKGMHTRIITEGSDVCATPVAMPQGDILYCCHGVIKHYEKTTKKRTVLIGDGYCVAPSYSPVSDQIAYAKRVGKEMQIYLYDQKTGRHEQLTFASKDHASSDYNAHKTDPCWAPDGIHLVFCWERSGVSRIALLNTLTKNYHFITSENEFCSYPAWSGNLAI